MDERILRALLTNHCKAVFETMLGVEVSEIPGTPQSPNVTSDRVVALIGFGGDYVGSCTIGCSKKLACRIASGMLFSDFTEVDGDVIDVLGEISNMIFGNVKVDLEEFLGPLCLSIPSVIVGWGFNIRSASNPSKVSITFKVEDFEFEVEMSVTRAARSSRTDIHTGKVLAPQLTFS